MPLTVIFTHAAQQTSSQQWLQPLAKNRLATPVIDGNIMWEGLMFGLTDLRVDTTHYRNPAADSKSADLESR